MEIEWMKEALETARLREESLERAYNELEEHFEERVLELEEKIANNMEVETLITAFFECKIRSTRSRMRASRQMTGRKIWS